jgi:transposase
LLFAQGMQRLLYKLGFSYKQLSLFPSKADLAKQREFVKEYEKLTDNLTDKEEIVFIDGVHPQHNTKSSKAWIESGQEKYILTNTGRVRINLNGAYNPKTQDVIIREDETINAQSTINLFKQIEEHYTDKDRIFVISDNARYYTCKMLTEFLQDSKIELIHLPPYSPNLNLIERLWKFMRKKVINTKYYEKFSDFRKAIKNFFDNIDTYAEEMGKFIGTKFHLYAN